jgi:hypothetical protein
MQLENFVKSMLGQGRYRAGFLLFCAFFPFFGGAAVDAAQGNYGYNLIWASTATATCGSFAYMSANTCQYTNSTAITVGNNVFTIKRMSDGGTVASYSGTSQAGPGCFDNCNYYYAIDITGNATYGNFFGQYDNYPACGTAAKRAYSRVYMNPLSSGMDYQQVYPINVWVNVDPQMKVQLINYPATITDSGTTYTLNGNVMIDQYCMGGTNIDKVYTYSGGKTTYTLPAMGLADGWHTWNAYFYVQTTAGTYIPGGEMPNQGFGLDRVAPVVNSYLQSPASPITTDNVTINSAVTDVLSGLSNIKVYLDGNLKNTCSFVGGPTTQQTCPASLGTIAAGSHTYYVTGTDQAGNTVTATAKSFGVTAAPTVTATFSAAPPSGISPVSSTLTATVTGGTATGNITYNLWYDCNNTCATVADCTTACGAVSSAVTQAGTSYTLVHSYTAGTFYPRAVVVRGTAVTAIGATVTVTTPTLTTSFTVAPTSGTMPLATTLTAAVTGGTSTGNMDYYLWWNCGASCTDLSSCVTACGAANDSSTAQISTSHVFSRTYATAGTYSPKAVIVRYSVASVQGATVTVATPTLTTSFSVAPPSGTVPLVTTLTAAVTGGTAIGNMDYYFWWNCGASCTDLSSCVTACGAANDSSTLQSLTSHAFSYTYATAGTYSPKVVIVRNSVASVQGATVTANPSAVAPTVTPVAATQPVDYCTASPSAIFTWTYNDTQGSAQSAYQLQFIDETKPADFSSPSFDTLKQAASLTWATSLGQLGYNHTYRWRVMVWNSLSPTNLASAWVNGPSFTTPVHQYPKANFISFPSKPVAGEKVDFTDTSIAYGGSTIQSWAWTFPKGTPTTSTSQNPEINFFTKNNSTNTLKITDSDGLSCTFGKTMIMNQFNLYQWMEISPTQ